MKLLTYLSIFQFVSTVLLSLQPTTQAKKPSDLSDNVPASRTASSRAIRSAPQQSPAQDSNDGCLNTTRGFRVEYTLITANSPDCELSLVDNFPVRVQYRTTIGNGGEGGLSEWMDSPCTLAVMPGENFLFNVYSVSESISKIS